MEQNVLMFVKVKLAIAGFSRVTSQQFYIFKIVLTNIFLFIAVANLTLHKKHLERVVPHDQTFNKSDYAGTIIT